ncbi:MAG: protein phosphatase CheZ [Thiomicrospira sp.]|nr:protein phosphatase CheZ [Thiomicrospira sp.]
MSFVTQICISDVQTLLEDLEAGDLVAAGAQLDKITSMREQELYQALGKMTRNLHETLNDLGEDTELLQQVKHDLPDVSERLQYVMRTTEEASEKTLASAEQVVASLDALNEWVERAGLTPTQQTELVALVDAMSQYVTNIMMAQSFQDLTGQVLNRIMIIMASFERSLLDLVMKSGHDLAAVPQRSEAAQKEAEMKGIGPNVTQSGKKDALDSQDDVDDLLGQLGF